MTTDHDGPATVHTGRPALDLDAIRARWDALQTEVVVDTSDRWDLLLTVQKAGRTALESARDVPALLAEVERLRARLDAAPGPDGRVAVILAAIRDEGDGDDDAAAEAAARSLAHDLAKAHTEVERLRATAPAEVERLRRVNGEWEAIADLATVLDPNHATLGDHPTPAQVCGYAITILNDQAQRLDRLAKERDQLKVQASNYAHDRDEARRERDEARREVEAEGLAIEAAARDCAVLIRERDEARRRLGVLWRATGIDDSKPVEFVADAILGMRDTARIARTQLRPQLARAQADAEDAHTLLRDVMHEIDMAVTPDDGDLILSRHPGDWQRVAAAVRSLADLAERYEREVERLKGARIISALFGHHPGAPRPFSLYRSPGRVPIALGAEFPDGAVALRLANDGGWTTKSDGGAEQFADASTDVVWLSDEFEALAEQEARETRLREGIEAEAAGLEELAKTGESLPEGEVARRLRALLDQPTDHGGQHDH